MEAEVATAMPIRGTKRAAAPVRSPRPKRARPSPPSSDDESSSEAGEGAFTPSTPTSIPPSRQKRLVCTWPDCGKAFSRPIHLAEHLNSHKGIRTHACGQCDKTFFRSSHLQHHVKNAHTTVREYMCDWEGCGKAFGTGTRLRRHMAAHTKPQPYRCDRPGCGQSFRKHATLQKHIKTEHKGCAPFVCDKPAVAAEEEGSAHGAICGAGFQTQGKLRSHHGRIHGVGRYWCTICSDDNGPLAFSTYTEFTTHNVEVHPPTCSQCPYTALSNKDLRQHLRQQHSIADPKVAADAAAPPPATIHCDRPGCDKTFSRRTNLLTHIKSTHEGRRFVCGEISAADLNHVESWDGSGACGKDFSAKSSLESHIRAAHLNLANPQRRNAKAAKKQPASKPRVSAAAKVAGTGYAEAARPLACLVTGCAFRFTRPYDRAVHARTKHGLGETEIAALAAAAGVMATIKAAARASASASASASAPALALAPAPQPAHGNDAGSDADDAASEANDSGSDYEQQLEAGAASGGVFWLGGNGHGDGEEEEEEDEDEWNAWEAEEMYTVVHGGGGGHDDDDGDGYEYDFTLEDDIPPDANHDEDGGLASEYGADQPVTGTGGRVDMMLLG